MDLSRSERVVRRLEQLPTTGSTNTDLLALADDPIAWPDLSVLVTGHQTAGRGRRGRVWTTPPGRCLSVSLLMRPAASLPAERWGWFPLMAGVAMAEAVRATGVDARVKWPNDVLVGGRKVSGILAERLADGSGVVIGAGVNVLLTEDELPVPTATSLALEGADVDVDALLAAWLERTAELARRLTAAGGDAEASGVAATVRGAMETIGREVAVELPDGSRLLGTAADLDADGGLVVTTEDGPRHVAAGDVTHLRYH